MSYFNHEKETVSHADQVSTTYISDQHQQQVSTQFQSGQSRSPKKRNRAIVILHKKKTFEFHFNGQIFNFNRKSMKTVQ